MYAAPTLGNGFIFLLVFIYLMKFSTDVLLMAPATIGSIFGLSRIWDAVSDPMAGFLSDRTRTRFGRRRPWMLASIIPVGAFFVMTWSPPRSLTGGDLVLWMTLAIFGLFTALTLFQVPHTALGAELSPAYHERNRIFGYRNIGWGVGSLLAPIGLYLLVTAPDPRATATILAIVVALVSAGLMLIPVVGLRERPEHAEGGPPSPLRAVLDVARNPHARLLLLVFFIENMGTGAMAVLAPYVLEYVAGVPKLMPFFFPLYFVPMIASIPFWMRAGRRIEKKWLWVFSMSLSGLAFGGMFFIGPDTLPFLGVMAVVAGIGGGGSQMLSLSIQADTVDWDELRTGQRKEGTYFAAWNLVQKSSAGVVAMITGFALEAAGFVANAPQSEDVKIAMRALFGLLPFVCYAVAIALFLRFRLTAREHARIRQALASRKAGASP